MSELILRPDQQKAKSDIYRAIGQGDRNVVLQAATSFGKTALAASITHDALSKGLGVIFTAPMITLVDQTLDEFYGFGVKNIGVIQADHPETNYECDVQICSIQSIAALMKKDPSGWSDFQKGRVLIFDEVHIFHKTYERMMAITDKPVIGLSATPWRKGLGKHFDKLVLGPEVSWLIENGHLSPYRAYSHYVPDMKGVAVNASGDYSSSESGDKYDPRVIGDIVKTWQKHAEGRKTVLFAPRVADAERFAAEFRLAGYRAVAVSGYMDQQDCAMEVERFRNGELDIIASVAKLATGFSVRDVGCLIDAQPTKSLMRHIQKYGRGLRTHPDKEDVIILDNAGNILRNGLPDGDFPIELNDGENNASDRKKDDDPLPVKCASCGIMKPPKTRKCPACGFEPTVQSELHIEEGELIELDVKRMKKANKDWPKEKKRAFFGGLKQFGIDHNFKPGWASWQYRERLGYWPNAYKDAPLIPPNKDVTGWITHQAIKKAKSA
ncbi:MAG: DEAD/DEAH box helicase family protein [Candidatus Peribacteraceae bacterium]|nr:DEAD/DEAH box helicase family protein [Candidatus Peribacteraceae bacterium]